MNTARSTLTGDIRTRSLTVRIEPHAKGEVFTLDRVEADGRATSSSSILHLDGEPRQFQDFGCSGIQSSRQVDNRTVEILRMCATGDGSDLSADQPCNLRNWSWRSRSKGPAADALSDGSYSRNDRRRSMNRNFIAG